MEAVSLVHGIGVPMRRSTVDTDQIIPAKFLKRITKTGYDDALFYEWRQDPDFILNTPPYDQGKVLVTGPDFGTGSSREHAVWALRDFGFGAVVSSRFGDIFRGNAGKQGLVVATVPQEVVEQMWAELEAHPGAEVAVDVAAREVRCGAMSAPFDIDDYTRWRLMEGLDDIGLTLRHEDAIEAFESSRDSWRPRTLPIPGG
jgi:3-isopropylmalate/(R)-2-methylmalate dehydratase small subunit